MKQKRPLIISGPCSAETEEQTVETCKAIAASGKVDILRAGIWKPRTKPGCFEGVGERGLPWLTKAKHETGLPIAIEVANAKHVFTALSYDVDYLWIGARTTVSPFSVQEIANAIKGSNVKVFIKNPMNPDIALWAGAVERIAKSIGQENVGLIHRGFSSFGHSEYRNAPMWHLIFEMRSIFPEMVTICDPSHICGCREKLLEVSQKAADLNYDGLIIESHICPDKALSDASQQVTPTDLVELLDAIKWRDKSVKNSDFNDALAKFRSEIDQIDSEIFELLSRRMRVAEEIGKVKRDNNVTILQSTRWSQIVDKTIAESKYLGLSENFMRMVLDAIHIESINRQNEIMNGNIK